jgi:hypothetical protein
LTLRGPCELPSTADWVFHRPDSIGYFRNVTPEFEA